MDRLSKDVVERSGQAYLVEIFLDDDTTPPWKREEGHGSVTDWTKTDKRPGEWILCEDHGFKRYYNFQEAIKTALKDGWDAPPYKTGTRGQTAERAVKADFKRLQDWCNDVWRYVGVVVTLVPEDEDPDEVKTDNTHAIWGVESDYTNLFRDELISEIEYELVKEEVVLASSPEFPVMETFNV